MKPRHLALGAALVLAAGLVVFGDTTPPDDIALPVERTAAPPAARSSARVATAAAATGIMPLVPRDVLIGAGDARFGAGEGGPPLFGRQDWTPPPPPAPREAPPGPPPPPSAPPLPFKFIGKSLQDGAWEVYLARNEQTYLVRDGATLDGMYRVDAIRPPVLTLTYLPLNHVQQLNIGVFD